MLIDFDSMETTILPHFKEGDKELQAKMYWDGTTRIMRGTLIPGASIGLHQHEGSCEMIIILQGHGSVIDCNGQRVPIHEGQCQYCPEGQTHSLINDSAENLVFYGIVPKQ